MTSPLTWWRSFDAQSRVLMVAGALNFTAIMFLPPPLFVWLLVVDLCAGCAALGWWCLVLEDRLDTTTSEALTLAYEARIATDLLAQREVESRRMGLRVVPAQRDGSEYEWPRIARAIGIDEIGDKA